MASPGTEPRWVTQSIALEIHHRQIARYGGSEGLRDPGLLDSGLNRPINLFLYEGPVPLSRLAASYCFGISRNHSFVDGNKRAAYVVARVFLLLNGLNIAPAEDDIVDTMLAVANGEMTEVALAEWFESHVVVS
ncbi:MAG: type II toxin-antitoxin system death-on-curing family toxin [Candidatus Hydrogenedentes bacterium]|nr:type II toxin-antitoxin system death-on-curing family toxin [Candidatus Hydrogenedentota bacterium]